MDNDEYFEQQDLLREQLREQLFEHGLSGNIAEFNRTLNELFDTEGKDDDYEEAITDELNCLLFDNVAERGHLHMCKRIVELIEQYHDEEYRRILVEQYIENILIRPNPRSAHVLAWLRTLQ